MPEGLSDPREVFDLELFKDELSQKLQELADVRQALFGDPPTLFGEEVNEGLQKLQSLCDEINEIFSKEISFTSNSREIASAVKAFQETLIGKLDDKLALSFMATALQSMAIQRQQAVQAAQKAV